MPTLEEFLSLPIEEVAKVAPASVCITTGGSRRAAAMAGIAPRSMEYASWGYNALLKNCKIIFDHGASSIFCPLLVAADFQKTDQPIENIVSVCLDTITSERSIAHYNNNGWRVRLLCDDRDPDMAEAAHLVYNYTAAVGSKTLYWMISKTPDDMIDLAIRKARLMGASGRKEAIRAITGEYVDLITMLIGFGKPMLNPELIPPILIGRLQCYWLQKPSLHMTDQDFKEVLYDYVYTRDTHNYNKVDRMSEATQYKHVWSSAPTLGIGMRLGRYWFPAKMTSPAWEDHD